MPLLKKNDRNAKHNAVIPQYFGDVKDLKKSRFIGLANPFLGGIVGGSGASDCGGGGAPWSVLTDLKGCQSIVNRQKNFTDNTVAVTNQVMNNVTQTTNISLSNYNEVNFDVKVGTAHPGCDLNVTMENAGKITAIVQSKTQIATDVTQKLSDKILQEVESQNDQKNSGLGITSSNQKIENDIENHINNSKKISNTVGSNIAKGVDLEGLNSNVLNFKYRADDCYAPINVSTVNNGEIIADIVYQDVIDSKVDQDLESVTSQTNATKNSQVSEGLDPFKFLETLSELIFPIGLIFISVFLVIAAFILIGIKKAQENLTRTALKFIYPLSITLSGVGGIVLFFFPIIASIVGENINYAGALIMQLIGPWLILAAFVVTATHYEYYKTLNSKYAASNPDLKKIFETENPKKTNEEKSFFEKIFGQSRNFGVWYLNYLKRNQKSPDLYYKHIRYDTSTKNLIIGIGLAVFVNLYILLLFHLPDEFGVPLIPLKAQSDTEIFTVRFKFDQEVTSNQKYMFFPVDELGNPAPLASLRIPRAVEGSGKTPYVREIKIINAWETGGDIVKSRLQNEVTTYPSVKTDPQQYRNPVKKLSDDESDRWYTGYTSVSFQPTGYGEIKPIKYCSGSKEHRIDFFVGMSNAQPSLGSTDINYRKYAYNSNPTDETHKRQAPNSSLSKDIMLVDGLLRNILNEDALGTTSELREEDGSLKEIDAKKFTIGKKLGYSYGFPDNSCKVFGHNVNSIPFSLINIPGTQRVGSDVCFMPGYEFHPFVQVNTGPNCSGRLKGEFLLQFNLFTPIYTSTDKMMEIRRLTQRQETADSTITAVSGTVQELIAATADVIAGWQPYTQ